MVKKSLLFMLMVAIIGSQNIYCASKRKPGKGSRDEERAQPKQRRVMSQEAEQERKEEIQQQEEKKIMAQQETEEQVMNVAQLLLPKELTALIDEYAGAGLFDQSEVTLEIQDNHFFTSAMWSPDGKMIVTGSSNIRYPLYDTQEPLGSVLLWDANTGKLLRVLKSAIPRANITVAFNADGTKIFALAHNHTRAEDSPSERPTSFIMAFDVRTGQELFSNETPGVTYSMVCSPTDPDVVAIKVYDRIDIINYKNDKLIISIPSGASHMKFSFDGSKIVGWDPHSFAIWRIQNGVLLQEADAPEMLNEDIRTVAFSPDGTHLVLGGDDGPVLIYSLDTGKETLLKGSDRQDVEAAEFSPDGTKIVSISSDFTMRIFDVHTGKELQKFDLNPLEMPEEIMSYYPVLSVDFSPDSRRILSLTENFIDIFVKNPRLTPAKAQKKPPVKREAEAKILAKQVSFAEKEAVLQQFKKIRDRLDLYKLLPLSTIEHIRKSIQAMEEGKGLTQRDFAYVRRWLDGTENLIQQAAPVVGELEDMQKLYQPFFGPVQNKLIGMYLASFTQGPLTAKKIERVRESARSMEERVRLVKDILRQVALPADQDQRMPIITEINKQLDAGKSQEKIIKKLKEQGL